MKRTVAEHIGLNNEKEKKQECRTYFLDDLLEQDPRNICPGCESSKIRSLHMHDPDAYHYKCSDCNLQYELYLYTKKEAGAH